MPVYIDYDTFTNTESEYYKIFNGQNITQNLQTAINECPNTLRISTGNYFVNDEIIIENKTNFKIFFENVTILIESTKVYGYIFKFLNNTNIEVSGSITIMTQHINQLTAYYIQNCKNSVFNGLRCDGVNDTNRFLNGVQIEYAIPHTSYLLYTVLFKNIDCRYCQYGFQFNEINVSVESSQFLNCSQVCLYINYKEISGNKYTPVGWSVKDCIFKNSRKGIYLFGFQQATESNIRNFISNCIFDYLTVCGIHFKEFLYLTNIDGCEFSGIFSNPSTYTPTTLQEAVCLDSTNKRFGIYLEGSDGIYINNCIFNYIEIFIGFHGVKNLNINSNSFTGSSFLTVKHIKEMENRYNVGYYSSNNTGIIIKNNYFTGSLVGNPETYVTRYIDLYTEINPIYYNLYRKFKIFNNYSSFTGTSRMVYNSFAPTGFTYLFSCDLNAIDWDIFVNQANRPIILHSSQIGNEFELNCYSTNHLDNYDRFITFSQDITNPPQSYINCSGIRYDSTNRRFVIMSPGKYKFSPIYESEYGGWIISSDSNSCNSILRNTNQNITIENSNVQKYIYIDTSNGVRTITFNNMDSMTRTGLSFYISCLNNNNSILFQNSTSYNIIYYSTKTQGRTVILSSNSLLIPTNELYHLYHCVYIGDTIGQYWTIHQL